MEIQFLDWIQGMHNSVGDVFWSLITKLGNAGMIWILLTIVLLLFSKTRKSGIILSVALCVDLILCNGILKNIVARVRPYDVNTTVELMITKPMDFSFPSGHTAASFTAVTALYFAGEKKLWKLALLLSVLIAFSRMYFYVHYPTDILGGMGIGVISGYIGYWIVNLLVKWKNKKGTTQMTE